MNNKVHNIGEHIKKIIVPLMLTVVFVMWGCGDSGNKYDSKGGAQPAPGTESAQSTTPADNSGLTEFQLKNGIGPITAPIKLGPIDKKLVAKGEKIFETKCMACHKLDERYVGPAQRNLIERRSPEYIMNMMLNPAEMIAKHPEAKKMLAQYMTPMPNQNLTVEDARAVLEYFRKVDKEKK